MEVIPSLLTIRSSNGVTELCASTQRFLHYLACAFCLVTLVNILFGCFFSIHCTQILPTVSYLACYKGHERIAVFSTVIFGLCLAVLFFAVHVRLYEKATRLERYLLLFLGLCVIGIVPAVSIIDELNGLYFAPLDFVHSYLVYGLLVCSLCYIYLAYSCVSDLRAAMSIKDADDLYSLKKWSLWTIVMTVVTVVQWQVGYSIYSNFWFNENAFALSEWTTITLAAFLPSKFGKVLGEARMILTVEDFSKKETEDDDIAPAQESYYSLAE